MWAGEVHRMWFKINSRLFNINAAEATFEINVDDTTAEMPQQR